MFDRIEVILSFFYLTIKFKVLKYFFFLKKLLIIQYSILVGCKWTFFKREKILHITGVKQDADKNNEDGVGRKTKFRDKTPGNQYRVSLKITFKGNIKWIW